MSYELPRPAKLKVDVKSKFIGQDAGRMHKAGKNVKVQRSPSDPGVFVIWFGKNEVAKVPALQVPETIEYTDHRA